ncbi:MAG: hypothetical protein Fur0043_07880 [Anaerolineales bacterium]
MAQNRKNGYQYSSNWFFLFIHVLIVFGLTFPVTEGAFAEGSRDLYPAAASGNRGNLEWRTSTYGPPGSTILRRTLLKVFANAGEVILVGSTTVGVNNGDIWIYNPGVVTGPIGGETVPGVASFSCNTLRVAIGNATLGRINSRTEELTGPDTIANPLTGARGNDFPAGYVPCYYTAPTTGIYDVVILGPSGFNSNNENPPPGDIALTDPNDFNAWQATSAAAWDVTVRSGLLSTTDINGRLFTYYLAQMTGGNGRPLNSSLYIATSDGFLYRTDLRGMDPYGFLFYGNRAGFYDSDGITPLYHDVMSTVGAANPNQLTELQGGVFMAPPEFPLFFNLPDPAALTALGIPLTPVAPMLNTFQFTGTAGGNQSYAGTGGTFSFISNTSGFYDIILSRDGINFDPADPANRVIHAFANIGLNTINWDGRDNSGADFPVGNYQVRSTIHAGELHTALIDVENSVQGGPSYTLINPPGGVCPFPALGASACSGAFYDDRGYQTMSGAMVGTVGAVLCGNNPPATSAAVVNPFDSTSAQRAFGAAAGGNAGVPCLGAFGDTKGLDLWTYYPSQPIAISIIVVPPAVPPAVAPAVLPATGFAPNMTTNLPQQPGDESYFAMDDLWLEIPSENVKQNIVGVPAGDHGWDVTWLGNDIGYLAGTAFPTWAGNSVLVGHVYNANGRPGPFMNIGNLSWGQQVIVHAWGQKYIYEVRTVNKWVLPTDTRLITKHEVYPWLTLVTCHDYDQKTNRYNYRTIVRAVLIKIVADDIPVIGKR